MIFVVNALTHNQFTTGFVLTFSSRHQFQNMNNLVEKLQLFIKIPQKYYGGFIKIIAKGKNCLKFNGSKITLQWSGDKLNNLASFVINRYTKIVSKMFFLLYCFCCFLQLPHDTLNIL